MSTTIYFFSGTGNSLKIARDLAKKLNDTDLVAMAKVWHQERITATSDTVGFVFPLYFYGLPDIVHEFMKKIVLEKVDYIFTVVTCGSPVGCALHQIDTYLKEKSQHLNAGFYIPMPSNYIPIADIIPEEKQKKRFLKAERKLEMVARVIKEKSDGGKKDKPILKTLSLRSNSSWLQDVHTLDKHFHLSQECISCGFCEKVCPVNNITLVENKPTWQHHCQQCFACLHFCPKESIQFNKKTAGRQRYHHPEVTFKDIVGQKLVKKVHGKKSK